MRLKERVLILLIAACCVICIFFVITTRIGDDYRSPYYYSEDFAKLSERASFLPPFQKRFLYRQMSKELEQHQKSLQRDKNSADGDAMIKETGNSAKNSNVMENVAHNRKLPKRLPISGSKLHGRIATHDDFSDLLHIIGIHSSTEENEESESSNPTLADALGIIPE